MEKSMSSPRVLTAVKSLTYVFILSANLETRCDGRSSTNSAAFWHEQKQVWVISILYTVTEVVEDDSPWTPLIHRLNLQVKVHSLLEGTALCGIMYEVLQTVETLSVSGECRQMERHMGTGPYCPRTDAPVFSRPAHLQVLMCLKKLAVWPTNISTLSSGHTVAASSKSMQLSDCFRAVEKLKFVGSV